MRTTRIPDAGDSTGQAGTPPSAVGDTSLPHHMLGSAARPGIEAMALRSRLLTGEICLSACFNLVNDAFVLLLP